MARDKTDKTPVATLATSATREESASMTAARHAGKRGKFLHVEAGAKMGAVREAAR
jgi:hypothetical protein